MISFRRTVTVEQMKDTELFFSLNQHTISYWRTIENQIANKTEKMPVADWIIMY